MFYVQLLAPKCKIIAVGTHIDTMKVARKKGGDKGKSLSGYLADEKSIKELIAHDLLVDAYHPKSKGLKELEQVLHEYALKMKTGSVDDEKKKVPVIGRMVGIDDRTCILINRVRSKDLFVDIHFLPHYSYTV